MTGPDKPILFLTGATGFIGFPILLAALSSGYQVRATVRSEEKFARLLTKPALQAFSTDFLKKNLSSVYVPDIAVPNAYDGKFDGVTHIIHAGTSLPVPPIKDPEREIFQPTVIGTRNLLEAARKTPTVVRVIITSSLSANIPWPPSPDVHAGPGDRHLNPQLPADMSDIIAVYAAGKATALNEADHFMKSQSPQFTLAHVFPGFVFGRNELATTVAELSTGSNGLMLRLLSGFKIPFPRLAGVSHLDDVVEVHMLLLGRSDNRDWGVSKPVSHEEPWAIVKNRFPNEVEDGTFTQGSQANWGESWNSDDTETELGIKLKDQEQMVVDVVEQFLELRRKERSTHASPA